MAQDIQPMVTYGGAEPYTDYMPGGGWAGMREWTAEIKIDPFIDLGKMYIRVKDAVADDDRWLRTGTDEARFFFNIEKSSAQSMALQGTGTGGANELTWMQDDYETLAGYNIYRSTNYDSTQPVSEQGFTKVNRSVISDDECAFSDTDVEQGVDYYYYFTVVDTAFNESPASNVIMCTPLDTEKPVITHTPITAAVKGEQIAINANVTDNVKADSVTAKQIGITPKNGSTYINADVSRYRKSNALTWHELNDGKHMQLVPKEINSKFTHVGGVGEINAGAYEPRDLQPNKKGEVVMFDKVFGELTYDYNWNGELELNWFGEIKKIDLVIYCEEDEKFDDLQYQSFQKFIDNWKEIESFLLDKILLYYIDLREELGFSDDSDKNYPEVTSVREIKEMIELDMIVIPYSDIYDGRSVAMAFSCDWDAENGLGVLLVNEKIEEIGYQDIAF